MKVLAIGHSHITNFINAHAALAERGEAGFDLVPVHLIRDFQPSSVMIDGKRHISPEAIRSIQRLVDAEAPDALVLLLQGSQAASLGLRNRLFDFFEPDGDGGGIDERLPIMPYDLVVEYFESNTGMTDRFLGEAIDSLPERRVAVSHPPLVGDADFVLRHLEGSSVHAAVQAKGIPPAKFRARLWRASVTAARNQYGRHGVPMLASPPEALDEDGCLAPAFRDDAVHAGQAYYELVVRQIATTLQPH